MISRSINLGRDEELLKEIHDNMYPEFNEINWNKLLCGFIIENDNKDFILAGAIQPTVEIHLLTNKMANRVSIGRALIQAQMISIHTCKQFQINKMTAFTNFSDNDYTNHLIRHGFNRRNQISLEMEIP